MADNIRAIDADSCLDRPRFWQSLEPGAPIIVFYIMTIFGPLTSWVSTQVHVTREIMRQSIPKSRQLHTSSITPSLRSIVVVHQKEKCIVTVSSLAVPHTHFKLNQSSLFLRLDFTPGFHKNFRQFFSPH